MSCVCVSPSAELCRLPSPALSWLSSPTAHNTSSWGVLWGGSAPESWQDARVHHHTRSAASLPLLKSWHECNLAVKTSKSVISFFSFSFSVRPSPPNSIEDGYEDAENNYPTTCINSHRKNSCKSNFPQKSILQHKSVFLFVCCRFFCNK